MYQFISQNNNIAIKVEAKTLADLFAESLKGVMDVLKLQTNDQGFIKRIVQMDSASQPALLSDFLNQAISMALAKKEIYTSVDYLEIEENSIKSQLSAIEVGGFDQEINSVESGQITTNPKGRLETIITLGV